MELDLGQKLNKIYLARQKLETNLFEYHAKITKYISANDRPAKTETYMEKSSICSQKIEEKNVDLKSLSLQSNNAAETINQLEFYLGSITAKHDDVLCVAKKFLSNLKSRGPGSSCTNPDAKQIRPFQETPSTAL